MRKRFLVLLTAISAWLLPLSAALAFGHSGAMRNIATITGDAVIPPLTQGELLVMAANRAPIAAVAASAATVDPVAIQLKAYVARQFAVCGFGLIPAATANEMSAFHRCTHAYLAGSRELLRRLATVAAPGNPAVMALYTSVSAELAAADKTPILCEYSAEPFRTDTLVYPDWRNLLGQRAVQIGGLWFLTLLLGGTLLATRKRRQPVTA